MTEETKTYLQRIDTAAAYILEKCGKADYAIILGSGLGDFANEMEDMSYVPYAEIPGFPISTVAGHAGRWCVGTVNGKRIYAMQGRFHSYEGYDMRTVTMPIRVMKKLGVKKLIVTNAAGGVNTSFKAGDLMVVNDFINMTGKNPLIGENLDDFGPRFPDMCEPFPVALQNVAFQSAENIGVKLQKGVYAWMNGPSYESKAEIRMLRTLGADAVGMSTVPEIIVARHSSLEALCISCITNMAAGVLDQPLCHAEVMETADRVKGTFTALVKEIIKNL